MKGDILLSSIDCSVQETFKQQLQQPCRKGNILVHMELLVRILCTAAVCREQDCFPINVIGGLQVICKCLEIEACGHG